MMDFNTTYPQNLCGANADNRFGPALPSDCGRTFDFTLLFEQSILSIAPASLLLLASPYRIFQLYRSNIKTIPNRIHFVKAVICATLIALQLTLLVLWASRPKTRASIPSAILSFLDALAIFAISYIEHSRSLRPSSILGFYLLASAVLDAVQVRTLFLKHNSIAPVLATVVVFKIFLLVLEEQSKRAYLKLRYRNYPPEATSGFLNRSFFWWINTLFVGGFRKLLSVDDLYAIDEDLSSKPLQSRMQIAWDKNSSRGRYALLWATISCLRWPLLSVVFPRACLIGFNYSQPFLISRAITYVGQPVTTVPKNYGYGLIAATALIYFSIAISTVQYKHRLFRMITMYRGATASLIYSRTLMLRAGIYDESAAITLMSTDIDTITTSVENLHEVWARTIEIAIGIWLLERQLGWVCIAPIVIVIIAFVGNGQVARKIGGKMKVWVEAVQCRVDITSSMLSSMKSVKMMGLSDTMSNIIQSQRLRELDLSRDFRWLVVWLNVFSNIPNIFAPVVSFVIFEIQAKARGSDSLNIVQAFTSLAIISLVSSPAAQLLGSFPILFSALACFDRIQNFLKAETWEDRRQTRGGLCRISSGPRNGDERSGFRTHEGRPEEASGNTRGGPIELQVLSSSQDKPVILVETATVRPSPGSEPVIHEISLRAENASLTMIIGPVGSGKSTILKTILGELPCDNGGVFVASKRMAFCAQTPWLLNTTIKQSVCGPIDPSTIDEDWYSTVMHACVLNDDMRQFPHGDLSVIGSRGLTLSGGQKQRLALARTAYARHDVVLLDDVLSALDAKTESFLVERLLGKQGIFRRLHSTVVLVTHATRHLCLAGNIIVLGADGRVAEHGNLDQLRLQNGFVSTLLHQPSHKATERHDETTTDTNKVLEGPTVDNLMDMTRKTGDTSIYKYYFESMGWRLASLFVSTTIVNAFLFNFPQVWLRWWAEANGTRSAMFISIYIILGLLTAVCNGLVIVEMFIFIIPKSAASLHRILLNTVMRAPQSFFAETDTGVTLNRFSEDMTLIDGNLPTAMLIVLSSFFQCIAKIALISTGSSYMGATIPIFLMVVYLLQNVYLRTSRQLRYMDLETRSPLYSHFLETLEGLCTIRAFGWQEQANETSLRHLDKSQRPYYLLFCIQRWLNLVLDLLVGALAVIVVTLAVQLRHTTSGGLLGIALNNVLTFNQRLSSLVTSWTDLETSLGAIARIRSFAVSTIPEDKAGEDFVPSNNWPEKGGIQFQHVTASYGPEAIALRDICFSVAPGQKVGICGRTGSGKSSLLLTLLRLLDMESGTITIDGLDLQKIPREMIRSRIITIPQDPFIISGTVRLNANPMGSVEDDAIVEALTKIGLWDVIESRGGLDADLNVQPLSQGQQQLFCLARALLRRGTILVLDEATSSVDAKTDQLIQEVIHKEFKNHTIITVAHRLNTILDSDKVAVLDRGRLVEYDSPSELLSRPSAFKELHGK